MRRLELALAPWVALAAACGGLASPDLGTGAVRGRIVGHLDGAYVYPLGGPDLKVSVAADDTFTVQHVPVETHEIVLVDGPNAAGTRRAARARIDVQRGGEVTIPDRYGDAASIDEAQKMPLAGTVAAFAQCEGGATAPSQRFTVVGTDQVNVSAGATGVAVMTPLPPGDAAIRAHADGFVDAVVAVAVVSGSSAYAVVSLSIDHEASAPGCNASGCTNGLLCAAGGACYGCRDDWDCVATHGTGSACDRVLHVCSSVPNGGVGVICDSCSQDGDCANVSNGYGCVASDGSSYCTRTGCAADLDCPAGFRCDTGACMAPGGCVAYMAAFAVPCWNDGGCTSGLNSWATCEGANLSVSPQQSGYCTARCDPAKNDDCSVVDGFMCALDDTGTSYVCQPQ